MAERKLDIFPHIFPLEYFERMRPMETAVFARKALDQVARNRGIIILPAIWRAFWWVERASPELALFLARRFFERNLKVLRGAQEASWPTK